MNNKRLLKILFVFSIALLSFTKISANTDLGDFTKPGIYQINDNKEVFVLEKKKVTGNNITVQGKDFVTVENIYELKTSEIIKRAGIKTNRPNQLNIIVGSSPCYEVCLDQIKVVAEVNNVSVTFNAYKPKSKKFKTIYVEDYTVPTKDTGTSIKNQDIKYYKSRNLKGYNEVYVKHDTVRYNEFFTPSLILMYSLPLITLLFMTSKMKKLRDSIIYNVINS